MTSVATDTKSTQDTLPVVFQYTVEAYKAFEKLAEMLPNPITANTFANFAKDERAHRDLLAIKYADASVPNMKITLGGDLRFQDMLEGDLSYREIAETLIAREKTMERKLAEFAAAGPATDRNLYRYIAAGKRAHIVLLERELELLRIYPDWFRREDAESVIVNGESTD